MTNQLCFRCRQLSFSLHPRSQCGPLSCKAADLTNSENHSELLVHFPSLEDLENSARSGCHLCSLLNVGLQSTSLVRAVTHGNSRHSVNVFIECRAIDEAQASESLFAIHGDTVAEFLLAHVTGTSCTASDFLTDAPRLDSSGLRHVKFRAIYMGPEIIDNQLYPGRCYDVLDVKQGTRLVRPSLCSPYSNSYDRLEWVDATGFGRCTYPVHVDCTCGSGIWELPLLKALQFGKIHAKPESVVPLIKDWLQICDHFHTTCKHRTSATVPSRLIEIVDMDQGSIRLVDGTTSKGKYTTLSYRWGNTASSSYVTTSDNIKVRQRSFFLNSLPSTIRDAITLTHRLGVPFIWIDAICIVQNSHSDWAAEGEKMDQIYNSSYLTISADGSPDADSGFLKERTMLGRTTCIHPSLVLPWDDHTPSRRCSRNAPTNLMPEKKSKSMLTGLQVPRGPRGICCGIEPCATSMDMSLLSRRGWILQERLLSRRILHWGAYEVSWECNELMASERLPAGDPGRRDYMVRASLDRNPTPWWNLRYELCSSPQARDKTERIYICPNFKLWHALIREYSRRDLTFPSDRLPAFDGLANAFGRSATLPSTSYRFGLWKENLPFDLCWFRVPISRDHGAHNVDVARIQGIPSFSWASIEGPVGFNYGAYFIFDFDDPHLGFITTSDEVPRMQVAGHMFQLQHLPKRQEVNELGETDTVVWDAPLSEKNLQEREDISCLRLASKQRMDRGREIPGIYSLVGLILVTAGEATNVVTPTFRRVGFYNGYCSAAMQDEAKRMTITIV